MAQQAGASEGAQTPRFPTENLPPWAHLVTPREAGLASPLTQKARAEPWPPQALAPLDVQKQGISRTCAVLRIVGEPESRLRTLRIQDAPSARFGRRARCTRSRLQQAAA